MNSERFRSIWYCPKGSIIWGFLFYARVPHISERFLLAGLNSMFKFTCKNHLLMPLFFVIISNEVEVESRCHCMSLKNRDGKTNN